MERAFALAGYHLCWWWQHAQHVGIMARMGMDEVLREAYERGIVLSGVSAGAICWFEQGITDSVWPLGVLDCLGVLEGSCCPHYDDEPERRPAYVRFTKSGEAKTGIGIAEESAAHYIDGKLHKVVAARKGKQCFQVSVDGEQELETEYLG